MGLGVAWRGPLLAAALAALAGVSASGAAEDQFYGIIVAPPQGLTLGYATPAAVAAPDGVVFHNLDLLTHNVVALDAYGSDANPWCVRYLDGACPIFWTPLIGILSSTPVLGLDATPPGVYRFYCTIHENMVGTLVVPPN